MAQRIGLLPEPSLARPYLLAGFDSSTCRNIACPDSSTNSIESLALIDNYVPPQSDEGLVDPILASVVSFCSDHVYMMKHFTDVKAYGHTPRAHKPMWIPPLPSF